MLRSILISLTAETSYPILGPLGRPIQAWFLSQLTRFNTKLASKLHDEQGLKPYTVSTLLDEHSRPLRPGTWVQPGEVSFGAQGDNAHGRAEEGVEGARSIRGIDKRQHRVIQRLHEHGAGGALFGGDQKLDLHVIHWLLRQRGFHARWGALDCWSPLPSSRRARGDVQFLWAVHMPGWGWSRSTPATPSVSGRRIGERLRALHAGDARAIG